jgi:4-amino-4-deoxy-L-arabinose transferase-like glycosyltransferase
MLAALAAPAVWRARMEPGCKVLLAWIVPSWIAFELVPTKLPHYVLPLYPALAILIAGVVDSHSLSRNRWLVRGTIWWFILMMAVALLLIVLQIVVGQKLGLLTWLFAAAAVIFSLFAWLLYPVDGAEAMAPEGDPADGDFVASPAALEPSDARICRRSRELHA